jgi:glucokinase
MSDLPALAIDVGGTKLAVGLVDPGGRLVASERVATPSGVTADADALWSQLDALVTRFTGDTSVVGVGVGCGGPMRWPEGLVSPLNIPGWREFPLRQRLAERFPGLPVRLHNDAVCFAVGEHWRGAGRGKDGMLGIVVSTGVGGGLVLGGHLYDGVTGNAGHVGHVVVEPDGPPCGCGGVGCLEAVARGPAIAEWAKAHGWESLNGTAQDVADDAQRGHPVAIDAIARAGRAIGLAVASVAAVLDLQVVTIGGGVSQAGPLLFDPLYESLRRAAGLDYARNVMVVAAELGQHAGLVGAAALILAGEDRYWSAG